MLLITINLRDLIQVICCIFKKCKIKQVNNYIIVYLLRDIRTFIIFLVNFNYMNSYNRKFLINMIIKDNFEN